MRSRNKFFFCLSAVFFFSAVFPGPARAAPFRNDGFIPANKIESRYFTILLGPEIEETDLLSSLDVEDGQKFLAGRHASSQALGEVMDSLFEWVCSVLDMYLYSYHGTVKVVKDGDELNSIYRRMYASSLPVAGLHGSERAWPQGFYVFEANTIYIKADDFLPGIIGHEVGHAVISNYFVVQPSMKVQEVLAGYIEYQLYKDRLKPAEKS